MNEIGDCIGGGFMDKQKTLKQFISFMSEEFKKQAEEMKQNHIEVEGKRTSEEIGKILERNPYF